MASTVPFVNDRNPDENIRVVVRCRPLSSDEIKSGFFEIIQINPAQQVLVVRDPISRAEKTYTFDNVFAQDATQPDIFNQVARPIIDNVLEGYNGTIFAYGQTGSGEPIYLYFPSGKKSIAFVLHKNRSWKKWRITSIQWLVTSSEDWK